jgi:hypothetical protein
MAGARGLAYACLAIGALLIPILASAPAKAQATRTWVSGVGDDANPCSRTAPCKTFAGAISKTLAGGEINVLDPGGFGALTITKAITIRSDHIEAGVLVSGTNGIVVTAGATDKVVLEGLDFDGVGTGLNGVNFTTGLAVYVLRCAIRNFTQNGINVTSNTPGARIFVKDSFIENNAGGVNVQGNGTGNTAAIADTVIDGNTSFAVQATNSGNVIGLLRSVLSSSPTAIGVTGGAQVISFGPSNVINGAGSPTTTTNYK